MSLSKSYALQCFSIPELRLVIFESLRYDSGTLAALARTSTQFHDSAITLLWKEQESLAPLIQAMPSDLWEVKSVEKQKKKQIRFLRPIVDNDWIRLDHYALKIHDLTLSEDIGVTKSTLAQLAAYRPVKLILPRLSSLDLDCSDGAEPFVEYLPILLGESLRRLSISLPFPGDEDMPYLEHLLCSIPKCCPNLTHLELPKGAAEVLESPSVPNSTLSTYLSRLINLEFLAISFIDVSSDVMSALGGLTKLQSLSLGLSTDLDYKIWDSPFLLADFGDLSTNPLFASPDTGLRSITMSGALAEDVLNILNAAPPSLRRFEALDVGGEAFLRELMEPCFQFTNMTTIILDYDGFTFDQSDATSSDTIYLLLSLQNLEYVKLRGLPSLVLTDPWLKKASLAWPFLSTLDLVQGRKDKPSITLEGLVPIALNCKRLVQLTIGALCRPFDVAQLKLKLEPSNLQELVFMRSKLKQPWGVMRCISLLFPSLKYAKGSGLLCDGDDDDDSDEDEDNSDEDVEWEVLNDGFKEAFS